MSWDNTSNIVSGDTSMSQYYDALGLGGLGSVDTGVQQGTSSLTSQVQQFLNEYQQMKEQFGDDADKKFKEKYGANINKVIDQYKALGQKVATDNANQYNAGVASDVVKQQARESTIANREAAAKQAMIQARNQGLSKGLASSIGNAPLSGQASTNYGNNLGALKNLGQTTQNDYLQKMGYANALEQQAENLENGSRLNVIGAAVGGAGTGAGIGASLFGGMGKGD